MAGSGVTNGSLPGSPPLELELVELELLELLVDAPGRLVNGGGGGDGGGWNPVGVKFAGTPPKTDNVLNRMMPSKTSVVEEPCQVMASPTWPGVQS